MHDWLGGDILLASIVWCVHIAGDRHQAFLLLPKAAADTKVLPSFSHLKCEERHRTALSDESLGSVQGFTSSRTWLVLMQEVEADPDSFKSEESLNARVSSAAAEDRRDWRPGPGLGVHHAPEIISI